MNIEPIAYFSTPLQSKFGVPRQSGLCPSLQGTVTLQPQWRHAEALKGIDAFDYIWLIWGFSENVEAQKRCTVRPPRLGGNTAMGVFATRSSFRPNNLALSSVRLLSVERQPNGAPLLHVLGADLADGTPIYDIKPYLAFTDAHPEAHGGFVEKVAWQRLEVEWSREAMTDVEGWSECDRQLLTEVLSEDPRPAYQRAERVYGLSFMGYEVTFLIADNHLTVLSCKR